MNRRLTALLVVLALGSTLAASAAAAERKPAAATKPAKSVKGKVVKGKRIALVGTELVANGSFETSITGWQGWQGSASRVANGAVGSWSARTVANKRVATFSLSPVGKQVTSTVKGAAYSAQAAVRTDYPGRQLCLRIREWAGSVVVGDALRCVTGSKTWQWIAPVSYTAQGKGNTLDAYVFVRVAVAGDRFDTDGFSLKVELPAAAPVAPPTALTALGSATTSVTLGWTASTDIRTTSYRVLQDGVEVARTATTGHVAGGLACGRSYTFAVRALDATGSESTAATAVGTTAACPLAPPTSLNATNAGETTLTLGWSAPTDARVVAYRVTRNGVDAGQTTGTSYAFSGLACGVSYAFAVKSLDSAGAGSTSATLSASTSACPAPPTPPTPPTPPLPPPPVPASACALYAAPGGSDSGAGTLAAPFATPAKLVATLAAGQTGCLRSGTYSGQLDVRRGGTTGAPITITSAPDERATILGRIVVYEVATDVTFRALNLNGKNSAGNPSPTVNGDRISFLDNDITNDHSAICFTLGSDSGYGTAENPVIERNRIHNCGKLPATNHDHGIYVEKSRNARIVDNIIYDNADRGIQLYPDAQGSYVAHNTLDSNGQGIIFSGDMGFASSNNTVVNNVISNSKLRYNLESWWPAGNPIGTNNVAESNCVFNGAQGNVGSQVGFTAVGTIVGDPQYADRGSKSFKLLAGSPCAGKGAR